MPFWAKCLAPTFTEIALDFVMWRTARTSWILRFDAQLYFANVSFFKEILSTQIASKGDSLTHLIIDAESINYLDSSATHAIHDIVKENAADNGIITLFTGVKGPVRDTLSKTGLFSEIGVQHFFMSIQEAVDWVDSSANDKEMAPLYEYTLQANGKS